MTTLGFVFLGLAVASGLARALVWYWRRRMGWDQPAERPPEDRIKPELWGERTELTTRPLGDLHSEA